MLQCLLLIPKCDLHILKQKCKREHNVHIFNALKNLYGFLK